MHGTTVANQVNTGIANQPLVVTGSVAGQAVVVVDGSLFLLGGFAVLTGVRYGLYYAHLSRDAVLSDSSSSAPMFDS